MDYFVIEVEIVINDLLVEIDDAHSITNTTINKKTCVPNDVFLETVENNFGKSNDGNDFLQDFVDSLVDSVVKEKKESFLPYPTVGEYKHNWDEAVVVSHKTYIERKEK